MPKSAKTSLKKEPVPVEVKMSGNPWDVSGPVVATLPVPNDVIITKIIGDYTERDRKLWTFLVAAVWDDLESQTVHEIKVSKINAVFEAMGGEKNTAWIWESASRLTGTRAYWKTTSADGKRLQGVAVLMSGAVATEEARASGVLRFEIPKLLAEVIRKPCRFSRLRLHFMIGLSGKYAVTLYMMLESVANMKTPVLDVALSQLREWLKIPDGKLGRWVDVKRRAVEPALQQINDNPVAAGFSVNMEEIKDGRAVARVRFIVTKTAERLDNEEELKPKEYIPPPEPLPRLIPPSKIPLPTTAFEQARKVAPGYDPYALEQQWREWLGTKENPDYSAGSYVAFCKQRGPYR
jgi:hypothetical protein